MPLHRLLLPLGVLAALALPASAGATLVYSTQTEIPRVYAAADDGSARVLLAKNLYAPRLSPDGTTVAAQRSTSSGSGSDLYLLSAAGPSAPRRVVRNVYGFIVQWAPDSKSLLVLSAKHLYVVNPADGTRRSLATGFITGASYSPAGDQVAFSRTTSRTKLNAPTDVYTVPLAGGAPTKITTDGRSSSPVWGPTAIAFTVGVPRHRDFPKSQIFLMNPDGSNRRQLTHTPVPTLVSGLVATQWSTDGGALLADFEGQDTSEAFAVDPVSGAARDLGVKKFSGITPFAISRDGTTVLAMRGGFEGPSANTAVVSIPFSGGSPTVLVKGGALPDWNR